MGYGVMPYAVDINYLKHFLGCKDESVLAELIDVHDEDLQKDMEDFDPYDDEETLLDLAIKHLIMGERQSEDYGEYASAYGYAFKHLCSAYGEHLNNSQWSAMRSSWFDLVDEEMDSIGIKDESFSMWSFFHNGPAVDIPLPGDFPSMGHVLRQNMPALITKLDKESLEKIKDNEARESLEQLREWLVICHESSRDLQCFYH